MEPCGEVNGLIAVAFKKIIIILFGLCYRHADTCTRLKSKCDLHRSLAHIIASGLHTVYRTQPQLVIGTVIATSNLSPLSSHQTHWSCFKQPVKGLPQRESIDWGGGTAGIQCRQLELPEHTCISPQNPAIMTKCQADAVNAVDFQLLPISCTLLLARESAIIVVNWQDNVLQGQKATSKHHMM